MHREGNKITFEDGYYFYETMHGPLIESYCDACDALTYMAEYRLRQAPEERDPPYNLCQDCSYRLWFGS